MVWNMIQPETKTIFLIMNLVKSSYM